MSKAGDKQDFPPSNTEPLPTASLPSEFVGVGGQIGPYKLLRPLGEGGFGVVYLAEQREPVKRRVALKIIKPGMDTKQVIARFEAERQALALLDHPNIAHVFDAGTTPHGRPYFVMELVKGVPLTEYCDRERFSVEARLQLFSQVCDAIQHAHQKGIIHRDIKPSNILVTIHENKPLPMVIDFGVAKATAQRLTEKTLFTEQGQLVGTPEYMSPEQAEMTDQDIDTRSDIYSLGVLLYELLTGALPFDPSTLRRAAIGEIQRIIREEEPPRPSTKLSSLGEEATNVAQRRRTDIRVLERQLQGDLDWITIKALEKDRTRRYDSAAELRADVKRHLNSEPVHAGPPTVSYRLHKFIQRHRVSVIATSLIVAALVTGFIMAIQTIKIWGLATEAVVKAKLTYIDLQSKTNQKLVEDSQGAPANDLAELPKGEQTFGDVRFKVTDALIKLGSSEVPDRPLRVEGIKVNKTFTELYIFHGTEDGLSVDDGTTIGYYILHYEDNTLMRIPIVLGEDVRDWWNNDDSKPVTRGRVAWIGQNAARRRQNLMLRLYLTAWKNPHTDKKVISIDYVSTNTDAAPFCVAMTVGETRGIATDE